MKQSVHKDADTLTSEIFVMHLQFSIISQIVVFGYGHLLQNAQLYIYGIVFWRL